MHVHNYASTTRVGQQPVLVFSAILHAGQLIWSFVPQPVWANNTCWSFSNPTCWPVTQVFSTPHPVRANIPCWSFSNPTCWPVTLVFNYTTRVGQHPVLDFQQADMLASYSGLLLHNLCGPTTRVGLSTNLLLACHNSPDLFAVMTRLTQFTNLVICERNGRGLPTAQSHPQLVIQPAHLAVE
jgi:hypothetical protein